MHNDIGPQALQRLRGITIHAHSARAAQAYDLAHIPAHFIRVDVDSADNMQCRPLRDDTQHRSPNGTKTVLKDLYRIRTHTCLLSLLYLYIAPYSWR